MLLVSISVIFVTRFDTLNSWKTLFKWRPRQETEVRKNKVERVKGSRVLEGRTAAFMSFWENHGVISWEGSPPLMLIRQSDAFEKYFSFSINIFPLFEINMFYKATSNTISES